MTQKEKAIEKYQCAMTSFHMTTSGHHDSNIHREEIKRLQGIREAFGDVLRDVFDVTLAEMKEIRLEWRDDHMALHHAEKGA